LAFSYVRNQEDALDVVQESIYKALVSIGGLKNPDAVRTWLYRIIVHTALDYMRKRSRLTYVPEEIIDLNPAKEDSLEEFDLTQAMAGLPDKHRAVIILRFFEDMKLEDIAQVLDENVNTFKTRLYKALKLLRVELEEREEEFP
jgi:RNA polymerase sigma-70 factor (ECF subfamily)